MNRCIIVIKKCLKVIKRCLNVIKRCVSVIKRCLNVIIKRGGWRRIPFRESPLLRTQARATPSCNKSWDISILSEGEEEERLSSVSTISGTSNFPALWMPIWSLAVFLKLELEQNTQFQTRSFKPPYKTVQARTQRLLKSPVPYFTTLLNTEATKPIVKWVYIFVLIVDLSMISVDNCSRQWFPNQIHLSLSSYQCTVINHSMCVTINQYY